jgi:hypothetical protein
MLVANNFWGKDDAGVAPLLDRMHNAKTTSDELKSFYTARAKIEDDYAKALLSLARKPLGTSETGTLRMSLDVLRSEVESMGKAHGTIAGQMKSELEEPLVAFNGGIKERKKIVQGGIEKLLKTKNQQTMAVNKARDRFEQDCLKIKGYLAQGHMVMGQEERKNKAKLEKTQIQMSANSSEYETAVKVLEETTGRWNREWKAACDKFQDLEEERLDFFKSSLWSFANIASTVCVSDDQSCEKVRLSLEDCEVEKDICNFIKDSGTGQEIPDPPKYINFCRGDIDDVISNHESVGDDAYSVAQFQRTMNPTFRTSSPQPSTFESHNDPDSNLRDEMGIPKARTSLQGEDAFMAQARSSHGSAAPPPLSTSQISHASAHSIPYAEQSPVPHNPYPTDGMTQFCRVGPPSERSSNPSPVRPGSRDSQEHSDYSQPTSYSSVDPASRNASPTKNYIGSNISGVSSFSNVSAGPPEDKQIQKKKSGFFQSPFGRKKSQRSREPLQQSEVATPTSRNTWTPATARQAQSAGNSPVKQAFGNPNRASTWNKQPPQASPDPDVDPRADYQLGIGNNVFEVAHPDSRKKPTGRAAPDELDPIARALAELKGVGKHASTRESADRHYGMSTPIPGTPATQRGGRDSAAPTPFSNNGGYRGTPPPSYENQPPVSRLGAPQPAHTKKDMQKATAQYVSQKQSMFNAGGGNTIPRPTSSMGRQQEQPPRASSPAPPRATSPDPRSYRAASPNPYPQQQQQPRPRAQSSSPIKQQHPSYARGASPGFPSGRAASPNPAYASSRPATSGTQRPGSSHGGGAMAMQLAPAPSSNYGGGSQRGGARPQSQYYAPPPAQDDRQVSMAAARTRSQSQGPHQRGGGTGRGVLHYGQYFLSFPMWGDSFVC